MKRVIGSTLVEDLQKEMEEGKVKENLVISPMGEAAEKNDAVAKRCFYKVSFDGNKIEMDSEYAMAYILEYAYYLCAKTSPDDSANKGGLARSIHEKQKVIITVVRVGGISVLGPELLHKVEHPRLAARSGLQEPRRSRVPARERGGGDGVRLLPQQGERVHHAARRGVCGHGLRGGDADGSGVFAGGVAAGR